MTAVVFADLVGSTALFERLGDEDASQFVTGLCNTLGGIFVQHDGRVVKLLGDGLFVVFADEAKAVTACIHIQNHLREQHIRPGGSGPVVQMQIGIESGEVVEIDGDCFGDTVNSAARLADLAGAAQILTTQTVFNALLPAQRSSLRSMGPMVLRGKMEASHVYQVAWMAGHDEDSTRAGRSMLTRQRSAYLTLQYGGRSLRFDQKDSTLSLGRSAEAALVVNDQRVSRIHATLAWRGGQCVLADASSFGTWVYLGGERDAVELRRTECYLVGSGVIVPGCERTEPDAPAITFAVMSAMELDR